jgi:hypothetical protein
MKEVGTASSATYPAAPRVAFSKARDIIFIRCPTSAIES